MRFGGLLLAMLLSCGPRVPLRGIVKSVQHEPSWLMPVMIDDAIILMPMPEVWRVVVLADSGGRFEVDCNVPVSVGDRWEGD